MSTNPAARSSAASKVVAPLLIRRAAVLGAGSMGSHIAAHLANVGIPTLMLDIPAQSGAPEPAMLALHALSKSKPAAFFQASNASLITPGSFDKDLPLLAECDWVIEAVTENFEIKTGLLARVLPHLAKDALLTTNTSGLPVGRIAQKLASHRERFFGTHFFNPPRYMRLLEVIATPETDRSVLAGFAAFADRVLGKQVVFANDTPNFIANRIGVALIFSATELMLQQGLTVEEVDALTGPALGWPRTGTFRLADLVGVDVLSHVAQNFPEGTIHGKFATALAELVNRKWHGDKQGQGFYKKIRTSDGKEERLVLDLHTLAYRPMIKAALPALDAAKHEPDLKKRLKLLLNNDPANDKAAAFLWPLLASLWNYAAERIGDAAPDAPSIDTAMRAGFNWELGPFQMWDAVGVVTSVARMKAMGISVSPAVQALISTGSSGWYSDDGQDCYEPVRNQPLPIAKVAGHARVADFRRTHKVLDSNAGASLVDLGDGVACIELHSPKNAIGGDVLSLIANVLNPVSSAVRDFAAFVVSGDSDNFSVGADLKQLLALMQAGEWQQVEGVIQRFQQMTAAIKFCPRPVVVAPFGLTLGGGAEMCLHAALRQPHAETYIGLVEAGIGLIPAGGGTKEMLLRALGSAIAVAPPDLRDPPSRFAQSAEVSAALKRVFEPMAMARVSTSAADARLLGLLPPSDRITMNRERLLPDAKAQAAAIAQIGYMPPQPRSAIPAPGASAFAALEAGVFLMREAGLASEHDAKVAHSIAYVLTGGGVTAGTPITEQYLLDLERELFLSLCGESKTQERIAFTLKTGKPLRN
jgi:3-hydroxyacyl-CoA dehydrogenase